jgi:hypothetical protein
VDSLLAETAKSTKSGGFLSGLGTLGSGILTGIFSGIAKAGSLLAKRSETKCCGEIDNENSLDVYICY